MYITARLQQRRVLELPRGLFEVTGASRIARVLLLQAHFVGC